MNNLWVSKDLTEWINRYEQADELTICCKTLISIKNELDTGYWNIFKVEINSTQIQGK